MTKISWLAILALSTVLPLSALAQTAPELNAQPAVMPAEFCKGGTVIIVDGIRECRIEDSLDTLIADFEQMEIAGNPINDKLNTYFETVKAGHDRVLKLRNEYQAKS